jgi:glycerol-3-phosphate acyltransferase PlsY
MKIALLVVLFLIGSIGGAIQALKYVERRDARATRTDSSREPE